MGQLSDLGLVELTRHRQGQSLSEIFSKKCPHCGGTGIIAEDLSFSSSVAEGEYRSKAAKLKLPVQQVKNKNQAHKHNKVFNHLNHKQQPQPQQQNQQNEEPKQNIIENVVEQNETPIVTETKVEITKIESIEPQTTPEVKENKTKKKTYKKKIQISKE